VRSLAGKIRIEKLKQFGNCISMRRGLRGWSDSRKDEAFDVTVITLSPGQVKGCHGNTAAEVSMKSWYLM